MLDGHARRTHSPSRRPQLTRRSRWLRAAPYLALVLLALTVLCAVPGCAVGAAVQTPVGAQDVVMRYTFQPTSMALLVHDSGELAAHDLLTGVPLWSLDTGGPVMKAEMLRAPSRETLLHDPLSTPLLVHGNQLFMRDPHAGTEPTRDGDPTATLLYFMNVSTLLRRQSVMVSDTDVYTTTSVSILDVDAVSGAVLRSTTPGPDASDVDGDVSGLRELTPVLHVVRYNIVIHAYRPGAYHWCVTLSQLRLLGKAESAPRDDPGPTHERFFSQRVKDMFGFDDAKAATTSHHLALRTHAAELRQRFVLYEDSHTRPTLRDTLREVDLWHVPSPATRRARVAFAHVWPSHTTHITRIPVWRGADTDYDYTVPYLTSLATLRDGNASAAHALVATLPDVVRKSYRAVVRRPGQGALIPFSYSSWRSDVAADEDEGEELQSYYLAHVAGLGQTPGWVFRTTGPTVTTTTTFDAVATVRPRLPGLPWRVVAILLTHLALLAGSTGLLCAGLPSRDRLRRAWAEVDHNRDVRRRERNGGSGRLRPHDWTRVASSENGLDAGASFRLPVPLLTAGTTVHSDNDNDAAVDTTTTNGECWWYDASHTTTREETHSERGVAAQSGLFQQHFNVLHKIGSGGEGSVFCVEHRVTHARYAIKVILLHDRDDDREVREAILHSSFDHPNVVRFYFCWIETVSAAVAARLELLDLDDGMDCPSCSTLRADSSCTTSDYGTVQGDVVPGAANHRMLFIQMEYFAHGTLADLLARRTGFTSAVNLGYLAAIAEGLAYLHGMDVVHRDLKPTNIFVGANGVLKIGDFGLARRRHRVAQTGTADPTELPSLCGEEERSIGAGSPLYSSPEQKRGEPAGRPSDIYSLGVLGVEMYGEFTTLHERIRCLTGCRQGVLPDTLRTESREVGRLFARMLADDPVRRPTARALVRALRRLLRQCASAPEATSTTSVLSDVDDAWGDKSSASRPSPRQPTAAWTSLQRGLGSPSPTVVRVPATDHEVDPRDHSAGVEDVRDSLPITETDTHTSDSDGDDAPLPAPCVSSEPGGDEHGIDHAAHAAVAPSTRKAESRDVRHGDAVQTLLPFNSLVNTPPSL